MKKYFTLLAVLSCLIGFAQNKDEQAIRQILANQTNAWNKGDINSFMIGYWENDSLVYIGKSGPRYGYATTLKNYQKNYPDTSHMGKLAFQIISVKPLNTDHYFVIGKWNLTRTVGDAGGYFTLLFRKINGQWKVIADHSS
ncbi:MAG: nuclear transport factor 2 family protein [Chitinophagia bacterium]|jgi:ketosteroid isomerase-like protein